MKALLGNARRNLMLIVLVATLIGLGGGYVHAQTPPPGPKSGTVGVEGTIPSDPPKTPATISLPSTNQSFTNIPITSSGLCPANTIVKVFSNEIFVGSAVCINGSYSIPISLFSGRNDIVVRVFDALDQQGPDSPVITVYFEDAKFAQFGSHVLLTSQYARRAANPGDILEWPLVVTGGLGPYALTVDWGDGTPIELRSEPFSGTLNFNHEYKASGVYRVTFKVADKNGTAGYLQVIAVATGNIATNSTVDNQTDKTIIVKQEIAWWPLALLIIPMIMTFWLGRKFELTRLRKRLEQDY